MARDSVDEVILDLDTLRSYPNAGDPDHRAHDAADRLLLDESAQARRDLARHEIAVIGDTFGALSLSCANSASDGVVRVHQDSLGNERALAVNARSTGLEASVASLPLDPELVRNARVVLLRLPRSLEALRDIAGLIAAHAAPDVVVFAGGRIKHMSLGMNEVLRENFDTVDVSLARQKSRVLISHGPHDGRDPEPSAARLRIGDTDVEVRAFGGVFAGATEYSLF